MEVPVPYKRPSVEVRRNINVLESNRYIEVAEEGCRSRMVVEENEELVLVVDSHSQAVVVYTECASVVVPENRS